MYSLKKNFERAKVVIIAELYKFLWGILCALVFLSRFCGVLRDIFLWLWVFVLDLWRWPGHFLSAVKFVQKIRRICLKLKKVDS